MQVTATGAMAAAAVATAVCAAGAFLAPRTFRFLRAIGRFLGDWTGTPGRPGHDRQPGVMETLHLMRGDVAGLREDVSDLRTRLTSVESEVYPNGGKSMRDAVHRIDQRTAGREAHGPS